MLFIIIILFLLLILIIYKTKNILINNSSINNNIINNNTINNSSIKVDRPFVNLYDNNERRLNVVLISKPFGHDSIKANNILTNLKKNNNIIIGITSYMEFPNMVSNTFDNFIEDYKNNKYKEICEAWLHCFKNPEDYFSDHIPKLLLSESDFIDCHINKPNNNIKKKYDFIYICLKQDESKDICDDWATYNKNWTLAKKCLSIMCKVYKLKGALIGRKDCDLNDNNNCNGLMHTTNILSNDELKQYYKEAKFIFMPNIVDASPRVLSEALLHNLPCLINTNILGGWKYVNNSTGMFFNDEKDIEQVLSVFLKKLPSYTPRSYFIKNYGPVNSGKKLKNFIYTHFGDRVNIKEEDVEYLTIDYPKKNFKTC